MQLVFFFFIIIYDTVLTLEVLFGHVFSILFHPGGLK